MEAERPDLVARASRQGGPAHATAFGHRQRALGAHHHGAASPALDDSEGEIEAAFAYMNVKAVGLYRKRCLARRCGEHASTSRD
jgi:hypothetical protein